MIAFSTRDKLFLSGLLSRFICTFRKLLFLKNKGVFKRRELYWELDLGDGIDFSIFLLGAFEPDTIKIYSSYIKPGNTVLDIGANIGAHTLHFARLVGPNGRVIAFEPTDFAFNKLSNNVGLNPTIIDRIELNQALLIGDPGKEIPTSIPSRWPLGQNKTVDAHPIHLGVFESLDGAKKIRLDDWYFASGKPKIDLIKIDVDGFEIEVLQGASRLISQQMPVIIMEFAPYVFEERGYSFSDLLQLLRNFQYNCFREDGTPLVLDISIEKFIPKLGSINAVLIPKNKD